MPLLLAFGLVVHELVHAAVVLLLGGELLEIRVLPTFATGGISFGGVLHDAKANPAAVALAPAALWIAIAFIATFLCRTNRVRAHTGREGPIMFLFVALPLVDLSLSVAGLALSPSNTDLAVAAAHVGVVRETALSIVLAIFAAVALALGSALRETIERITPRSAHPLSPGEFAVGYLLWLAAPWLAFAT